MPTFDYMGNSSGMTDIFTVKEVENGWLVYVFYDDSEDKSNDRSIDNTVDGIVASFAALPVVSKKVAKSFAKDMDKELESWKTDDSEEQDDDSINEDDVNDIAEAVKGALSKARNTRDTTRPSGPSVYCFSDFKALQEFINSLLAQMYGAASDSPEETTNV